MDNKKVTMTIKEIKRVEIMTRVETGKIMGSQVVRMDTVLFDGKSSYDIVIMCKPQLISF